jgi:hypothetical protein
VLEKKPQKNDIAENFESKFQVTNGNYMNFRTSVITIYKNNVESSTTPKSSFYEIVNSNTETSSILLQEDEKLPLWIENKDLVCNCPKMRLKRKYLVMVKSSNLLKYLPEEEPTEEETPEDNFSYETENDADEETSSTSSVSSTTEVVKLAKRAAVETKLELSSQKLAGLLVDRETVIIEWRPEFQRRMRRFVKLYKNGRCS